MQPYSDMLGSGSYVNRHLSGGEELHLQQRKAIIPVLIHESIPSRLGERRRITPLIVIDGVEVASLSSISAVHVLGHQILIFRNIRSRVSDGNLAITTLADILLHIASDSFNIWRGISGIRRIDNFVTAEEQQSIRVLSKRINGCEDALQVCRVVRRSRSIAVQRIFRSVDIEDEVDSGIGQCTHAFVVVCTIVNGVYTNRVEAELLEVFDVALTCRGVGERVCRSG